MASAAISQPIVVYQIERHPLEGREPRRPFRWLRSDDGFLRDLEALIGPFDPEDVAVLVDRLPAGPAWKELMGSLLEERVRMVITPFWLGRLLNCRCRLRRGHRSLRLGESRRKPKQESNGGRCQETSHDVTPSCHSFERF